MTEALPTLRPLRTESDYRAALAQAEALFDLPEEPDTSRLAADDRPPEPRL